MVPAPQHSKTIDVRTGRFSSRAILGTIIALGIVMLICYLWLVFYFALGDDLLIDLATNQTSFRITNQDVAIVQAKLSSQGQLFCTTLCSLELVDANGTSLHQENLTTKDGEIVMRNFTLKPNTKGTGQVIYSLRASCANRRELLCPSSGAVQRDTVLLSVNYVLPTQQAQLARYLQANIPLALRALATIDENLAGITSIISSAHRLHTADLLSDLAFEQERFSQANLGMNALKQYWSQEEYERAAFAFENYSLSALDNDAAMTQSLRDRLQTMPALHNTLRDRLEMVRSRDTHRFENYSFLLRDPYAGPLLVNEASILNETLRMYSTDDYKRYADMDARIVTLENESRFISTILFFDDRMNTVRTVGLVLGQTILDEQCVQNVSPVTSCVVLNASSVNMLCAQLPTLITDANMNLNTSATLNVTNSSSLSSLGNGTNATNLTTTAMLATAISRAQQFYTTYCLPASFSSMIDNTSLLAVDPIVWPNVTSTINTDLPANLAQCCVFGVCKTCCGGLDDVDSDTSNSCATDESTYPVIFVHGHSFNAGNTPEYSLGGYFAGMQRALEQDGYIDAGIVMPSSSMSDVAVGEWGRSGRPVTARVTYYYNFYRNGDQYILIAQKSETIETYALRLSDMINIIKHNTGKKKVNIVAHSMGGLVVRRYLQLFGEDSVDKVILIATPNNGTSGRTRTLCPVLGESKECNDMSAGSVFMSKLNDPSLAPQRVRITTIAGDGCSVDGSPGDGVVSVAGVALPYAHNYVVSGKCTDLLGSELHTEILNIDTYPLTYKLVKNVLQEK